MSVLNNQYYIWGAGTYGERLIEFMKDDINFKAVIDNDSGKQGILFHGVSVVSYEMIKDSLPSIKIVIALTIPTEVREFLMSEGFIENEDFFLMHDFIPRYFWEKNKSLVVKSVDIAATTMCSMKCRGCQTFIPLTVNRRHIDADSIMLDLDLLFKHIDSIVMLNIGVGESLLNPELPDICLQIYKKFSKRYQYLLIQTNGTVILGYESMRKLSEARPYFGISNYPENTEIREKFIELCNQFDINFYINRTGNRKLWYDYGDPRFIRETNPDKLADLYSRCWQPGMGLYNGLLYICAAQTWANMLVETGAPEPGDVFDLHQRKNDTSRDALYKIITRQPPESGYLSHCMRCNSVMIPYVEGKTYA